MPLTTSLAHGPSNRVLSFAALLLIMLGLGSVHLLIRDEFADARRLREEAQRIVEARRHLSELLTLHVDAETGVRGFVLTGQEVFLAPYRGASERRETIIEALRSEISEKSLSSLKKLRRLSDLKLANAAANVRDVRDGRLADAQKRIEDGGGKELMDEIRAEIARLDAAEVAFLQAFEEASENKRRNVERLVLLLLVGIAAILIAVTGLLVRTIGQRRTALTDARRVAEQERAMFDGAVDGMLLLDGSGRIMLANASIERMFGYSAKELAGSNNMVLMAEPVAEEQSLAWLATVGRAGVAGAGRRQEFIGKRADGSVFETEVAISQFGEDGNSRFVAAIRDITDRKRAERMKNEFVSTVSHELRTPLTSIGGSLALLAGGAAGQLDEKAARLVTIAHNNCERLIRLINDLLDIEKIESGKMSFDMRKLTLGPLIQRTVNANRQFAHDLGVGLEIGLPPWPQCVNGDPDRIEQVLTNLISNAIKFSPAGETVYVTTQQDGSKVRVEVCDRGSGVPGEFRDRIFSKFAQADSSDTRSRGGTGLGLAIAREIVTRQGGSVGFEDREGGGSIFWFELPMLQDKPAIVPPEQCDLPLLLHLDNDLDCLSVVASAFAGRASLVSASSMQEARAALVAEPKIGGCIVDVAMGTESGLDLIPELRAVAPGLPVVLFTALDEDYPEAGVDAALVKSKTSIETLVETTMALVTRAARGPR